MSKLYTIEEVALSCGTSKANIYKKLSKHASTYDQYITRKPMRLSEAGLEAIKNDAHRVRKAPTIPTAKSAEELSAELLECYKTIDGLRKQLLDEREQTKQLALKLAHINTLPDTNHNAEVATQQTQQADIKTESATPKPTLWDKFKQAFKS